jgi:enolase
VRQFCDERKAHRLRACATVAKYNQLLRIEEELGAAAKFPGRAALAVK